MLMGRAKPVIGYIMMGGSASIETELHHCLPEELEMATTRVPFRNVTYNGLLEMIDRLPAAAAILAEAHPSVIAVTSFTGSCIRGREMVNQIQQATGIPAVVPAAETVRVLHELKAKRIALVTCFASELRILEELFLNEHQIEVVHTLVLEGAGIQDPYVLSRLGGIDVAEEICRADLPEVDAILVDLPVLCMTSQVLAVLDRYRDVPILTMNQVLLWSTFEKVGASRENLYLARFLKP